MGVVHRFGELFSKFSDRIVRRGDVPPSGYYGTEEAATAYGKYDDDTTDHLAEQAYAEGGSPAPHSEDPFASEYGQRVPYQSQRDMQAEHEAEQKRREQELLQQRAYLQSQWAAQPQPQPQPPQQTAYTPPLQNGYAQPSNVVPFPGAHAAPGNAAYAHVEYIVMLRNRRGCTSVIEYIKSNASVFLNMELIADANERQRCVDMLSGAAYTLGCKLSKLSMRGIYLISSPSVQVIVDPSAQQIVGGQEAQGYARQQTVREGFATPIGFQPPAAAVPPQEEELIQTTQRRTPVSFGNTFADGRTGRYASMPVERAYGMQS